MDADEDIQGVKGQPEQSHHVSDDSKGDTDKAAATVDIPTGPASPSESSSNSDDEEETGDSDQWKSESFQQHRGPRTPSPPRGPRTPSPSSQGPQSPLREAQSPPHGPRTPPGGPRTPSPTGPQTPPSPAGSIEETPASPLDSPADDSDEGEYPASEEAGAGQFEEGSVQDDSLMQKLDNIDSLDGDSIQKFDADTPHSPVESADDSNVELDEINESNENRTQPSPQEQSAFNICPPSPPMPSSETMDSHAESPLVEQSRRADSKEELQDDKPLQVYSTDAEHPDPTKSPSQVSESGEAPDEPMEQDVKRDRPPSPMSPPPESIDSQHDSHQGPSTPQSDSAANGADVGFDRYHRRSPPPQVSMNTMDGDEFAQYRERAPSSRTSLGQSPMHTEDSREPPLHPQKDGSHPVTRVSEILMAAIREKTKGVRIEDSDSLLGSASQSSVLSGPDQSAQIGDDQSLYQKVIASEKEKRTDIITDEKTSEEVESNEPVDDQKPEEFTDEQQNETSQLKKDATDFDQVKDKTDNQESSDGKDPSTKEKPKDATSEATDIALHPENPDLEMDESKDESNPVSTEEKADVQKSDQSGEAGASVEGAAVVDVHHIDVHGDELDYEEDVEDHAKDVTKEDKEKEEGEEDDEEGAVDDDLDEGEITDDEEEGELKDPNDKKPSVRPVCRFFVKGHCTWGSNCRFIHPGHNDKGAYQFIDRQEFHEATAKLLAPPPPPPVEKEPEPEPEPEEFLPPPPEEPKEETAWERGLRHAKEIRKKAMMRREQDHDFETKRMMADAIAYEQDYDKENHYRNSRDNMNYVEEFYGYAMPVEDDVPPMFPESRDCYPGGQSPPPLEEPMRRESYPSPPPVRMPMEFGRDKFGRDQALLERQRERRQREQREREMERQKERLRELRRERHSPPPRDRRPMKDNQRGRDEIRGGGRGGRMDYRGRGGGGGGRDRGPPPPEGDLQEGMPPSGNRPADAWNDPWARRGEKPKPVVKQTRGRRRSRRSGSYSDSYSDSYSSFSSRSRSRSRSRSSSYSSASSRSSSASSYSHSSYSRSRSRSYSRSYSRSRSRSPKSKKKQSSGKPNKPGAGAGDTQKKRPLPQAPVKRPTKPGPQLPPGARPSSTSASRPGESTRPGPKPLPKPGSRPGPAKPPTNKPGPRPATKPGPARPPPGEPVRRDARPGAGQGARSGPTRQLPGPQRPGPQRPGPQRPGPQRPGPQRPGPQRPNPQRPNPQRPGPQRPGPQRPGPQQQRGRPRDRTRSSSHSSFSSHSSQSSFSSRSRSRSLSRGRSVSSNSSFSSSSSFSGDSDDMYAQLAHTKRKSKSDSSHTKPVRRPSGAQQPNAKKGPMPLSPRKAPPTVRKPPPVSQQKSAPPTSPQKRPRPGPVRPPSLSSSKDVGPQRPSGEKKRLPGPQPKPAPSAGPPDARSKSTSQPAAVTKANPLKYSAHKDIKLTLVKKPSGEKKRPPEPGGNSVAAKKPRTLPSPQQKTAPGKVAKPTVAKKPAPSPVEPKATKVAKPGAERKRPLSPGAATKGPPAAKVAAKPGVAKAAAAAKKGGTVNRREELLKQLKAVEDAIARKKAKLTK